VEQVQALATLTSTCTRPGAVNSGDWRGSARAYPLTLTACRRRLMMQASAKSGVSDRRLVPELSLGGLFADQVAG